MSTKIKLTRRGKTRQPYYRIVVADSRTKRNGRSIEEIGKYHPKEDPSYMQVDAERIAYWLGVGAQPTDAVRAILRVTGDWQKFAGEPPPEPMKVKATKPDRRAAFEAATQHTGGGEPEAAATTPKKKAGKADDTKADVRVDRADRTDVEVDVEATNPRAGVRQPEAKKAAAPKIDAGNATGTDSAEKGDPTKAGAPADAEA
ncbi:MAG: 30S ribosomal protein S16 [Geodermatophilaceae bacterium]|nr:30S ribosomal protein S16 [Geodermatophilaceae bacterium]